ncbi:MULTISPECIES: ferrous iron transport protein B [unclassified Moraxella]|uniref:ferrous iron transport protein B n=1 Tax=unclassified Moraxella TaxID=2685852 RepID=UPI003AF41F54
MAITLALVGSPNCGKTATFNALTGAKAKVANYSGVTVDKKFAQWLGDPSMTILDLPGTYSLRTTSPDEQVTREVLLGQQAGEAPLDGIIAVADATNLRLSLRMLLELKQLGLPMLVALNLSDVANARGVVIDETALSQALGVPVVKTVAIKREGSAKLHQLLQDFITHHTANPPVRLTDSQHFHQIADTIDNLDASELYAEVDAIIAQAVHEKGELPHWHERVDGVLLHPVWGMMILLAVLFVMFQAVYAWASPLMDAIEGAVGSLGAWLTATLGEGLLQSLLVDGVLAGVGGVLVFVPQIAILFLFILVLEDSGYLPRAAFLLDNLLAKTGLSGRAFIPLLSSFACAVPAVMATRTIPNARERLVTMALAPMLTCSARLPIYALVIGAVIPNTPVLRWFNLQGLTLFGLYLAGIISASLVALLLKYLAKVQGQQGLTALMMELPTYRLPNVRHIAVSLWDKVKAFLVRAGTVIFALSVILWVLVTFPKAPINATAPAIDYSMAGRLGRLIEPIFAPIGFDWQTCIAMIPGMAAREVVVAGLGTVYAVGGDEEAVTDGLSHIIHQNWGLPTAFAFLAWYIYAPMCLATIATIKRESHSAKYTTGIVAFLFVLAYIASFITYRVTAMLIT